MRRSASVLFFGVFATGAAMQGAAACSNSSSTPAASEDSGITTGNDAETTTKDTGTTIQTTGCSAPIPPVMTVTGPDGGQIAPDFSCYATDAGFLARPARPLSRPVPFDNDASDDGGVDASDASTPDAADSAPPEDAAVSEDASVGSDAASQSDAGPDWTLSLSDFVSSAPPAGATVNIVWGGSSLAPIAYTGTVDSKGDLLFPAPPAGVQLLSYNIVGTSDGDAGPGQTPLWWLAVVPIAPPGATKYNSLTRDNLSSLLTSVLASEKPQASDAVIVAGVQDCQNRDLNGAQMQIIDTATNAPIPTGSSPGDVRAFYLYQNLPNTACTYATNSEGGRAVLVMINAPTNLTPGATTPTHDYEVQFYGRMDEDAAAPVFISQAPIESYPGTVTVLRPTRLNVNPPN